MITKVWAVLNYEVGNRPPNTHPQLLGDEEIFGRVYKSHMEACLSILDYCIDMISDMPHTDESWALFQEWSKARLLHHRTFDDAPFIEETPVMELYSKIGGGPCGIFELDFDN
jgi:hypothetical protein